MYKNILTAALFTIATFSFAQQYPVNNNYENYNNSYYDNDFDNYNDYPDDYYYDYPSDYYPQSYYESYYNDYRNSILSVNWNHFFIKYRLNRYQIQQIINLNNRYQDFASWDYYYGSNPDRWYYERFHALQIILGPRIFINFQNNYYHGYNPVVYFQNYRKTYYLPRFQVRMPYRHVNIIKYQVNRNTYRNPRANNGLYDPNYRNNNNNLREKTLQNPNNTRENNGFRNDAKPETENNFRKANSSENKAETGFRNTRTVSENKPRISQNSENNRISGGFRNNSSRNESQRSIQKSNAGARGNSNPRGGGFR